MRKVSRCVWPALEILSFYYKEKVKVSMSPFSIPDNIHWLCKSNPAEKKKNFLFPETREICEFLCFHTECIYKNKLPSEAQCCATWKIVYLPSAI